MRGPPLVALSFVLNFIKTLNIMEGEKVMDEDTPKFETGNEEFTKMYELFEYCFFFFEIHDMKEQK